MTALRSRLTAAGLAFGALILALAVPADARAEAPGVDPAAVQILKQMTDYVGSLNQFSVTTRNTIEDLGFGGHRVDYDLAATVTLKRPDRLRAARSGELMDQHFFYDGKSLTLYNPTEKVYATSAAPETIEGMITYARETVGVLLPAADLLYRDAYPLFMQDVTLAVVVGKAEIGGVRCQHLLFSRPGVDFQIWIADGEQPWPHKYVVTETAIPARLSITTLLSDWNRTPAVDDAQFNFVPPKDAQAIEFLPARDASGSGR